MLRAADRDLVRAINRASVLRAVKLGGPVSRSEIARSSGMSRATVGNIVSELLDWDLLVEGDELSSTGGRPSRPLLVNGDAYVAAGVKLTEDRAVGALTDLDAHVLAEVERPLDGREPDEVAATIADLADQLIRDAGADRSRLLGVGVGLAGVIDASRGVCRYSPFLGWRDVHLGELVANAVGAAALVDNDVNTLALTERWFGIAQESADFLLVTVGRGVGLGVVIDGTVYRGPAGGAGEFGHTRLDGNERACDCGNVGCLEANVGAPALLERARELRGAEGAAPPASTEDLYALVAEDPDCAELVASAGRMLGRGIANLVNVFAPELVILSGEGLAAGDVFIDAVGEAADQHVFEGLRGSWRFVADILPEGAWARGAASLVLAELFETPTRTHLDLLAALRARR